MICPFCDAPGADRVIDSRETDGGRSIRRRRKCAKCGRRFTTYERIDETPRLIVIKKDGSRAPFERQKVLKGVQAACYKQRVTSEEMLRIADEVEDECIKTGEREIPTSFIGEAVSRRLRSVNKVAYVRFASVYREFRDLDELLDEVRETLERGRPDTPGQGKLFG